MLVADIPGLEQVRPGVDAQHRVGQMTHLDVGGLWAMPAAPAQVEPDPVFRQPAQRIVERVHPDLGERQVVLDAGLGLDLVDIIASSGHYRDPFLDKDWFDRHSRRSPAVNERNATRLSASTATIHAVSRSLSPDRFLIIRAKAAT